MFFCGSLPFKNLTHVDSEYKANVFKEDHAHGVRRLVAGMNLLPKTKSVLGLYEPCHPCKPHFTMAGLSTHDSLGVTQRLD